MKTIKLLLGAAFFAAALLPAAAEEQRIPRRIRFIETEETIPPMIPSILYSRLTRQVPLVVSKDDEVPHNEVEIAFEDRWVITLRDRNGVVESREFPEEFFDDPMQAAADFDETARDWAEYLDLVLPDVSEEMEVLTQELTEEISFEERLATPFQATLWLPVSARQIVLTDGNSGANQWLWQWPVRGDFAWYFRENLGVTASFRFEYGNHISFGVDINEDPRSTLSLMLMPGLGVQVRTIGRVSAEFGLSFFFGAVRITAEENLDNPLLLAGESMWLFYPVLSLEPSIVWSPNDRWSVKFRLIEFNLGLAGMAGSNSAPFGTAANTIIFNFLQVGAAYRW